MITLCCGGGLGSSSTSLASLLPEACEFALGSVPQPFEHDSHLSQFGLKLSAGLVRSAAVQLHVNLALNTRRLVSGVLRQRLRNELGIQSSLH